MTQYYSTVGDYVTTARNLLQDMIAPYRYSDWQIIGSLNIVVSEISRIRPDIFLDLKYQRPLRKGDTDDGSPVSPYSLSDITYGTDGVTIIDGTMVPIPMKYNPAVAWFMSGWMQLYDVADTQDQRAQAFLTKFQQHLMSLTAA